jgi:hypothetical protein
MLNIIKQKKFYFNIDLITFLLQFNLNYLFHQHNFTFILKHQIILFSLFLINNLIN